MSQFLRPDADTSANRCEVCGNVYVDAIHVTQGSTAGAIHTFDCFECAIHALAPSCGHCGCRVIGHGLEVHDTIFCSPHCVRESKVAFSDADADDSQADDASQASFPASDPPASVPTFPGRPSQGVMREHRHEEGKVGYILLWALGVPIPVLLGFFLLRGCT